MPPPANFRDAYPQLSSCSFPAAQFPAVSVSPRLFLPSMRSKTKTSLEEFPGTHSPLQSQDLGWGGLFGDLLYGDMVR